MRNCSSYTTAVNHDMARAQLDYAPGAGSRYVGNPTRRPWPSAAPAIHDTVCRQRTRRSRRRLAQVARLEATRTGNNEVDACSYSALIRNRSTRRLSGIVKVVAAQSIIGLAFMSRRVPVVGPRRLQRGHIVGNLMGKQLSLHYASAEPPGYKCARVGRRR